MPDQVFFPVAALLACLLVTLALDPFTKRVPSGPVSAADRKVHNMTLKGEDLYRFTLGNVGELNIDGEKNEETVKITLQASDAYDNPRYGTFIAFDESVEFAYQGRRIRITVTARSAGQFPASQFQANYSVGSRGESGWKTFELTNEFQEYAFEYEVPYANRGLGMDYLAVRPVVPEKERTVEIKQLHIKSLTPPRPKP